MIGCVGSTWTSSFFFFRADDGIRDVAVTGVQTCALPIWSWPWRSLATSVSTRTAFERKGDTRPRKRSSPCRWAFRAAGMEPTAGVRGTTKRDGRLPETGSRSTLPVARDGGGSDAGVVWPSGRPGGDGTDCHRIGQAARPRRLPDHPTPESSVRSSRASRALIGSGTGRRILVWDPRAVDVAPAGRDLERASLSRRRLHPEGLLVEPGLRLAEPADGNRQAHRRVRPVAGRLDRNQRLRRGHRLVDPGRRRDPDGGLLGDHG